MPHLGLLYAAWLEYPEWAHIYSLRHSLRLLDSAYRESPTASMAALAPFPAASSLRKSNKRIPLWKSNRETPHPEVMAAGRQN